MLSSIFLQCEFIFHLDGGSTFLIWISFIPPAAVFFSKHAHWWNAQTFDWSFFTLKSVVWQPVCFWKLSTLLDADRLNRLLDQYSSMDFGLDPRCLACMVRSRYSIGIAYRPYSLTGGLSRGVKGQCNHPVLKRPSHDAMTRCNPCFTLCNLCTHHVWFISLYLYLMVIETLIFIYWWYFLQFRILLVWAWDHMFGRLEVDWSDLERWNVTWQHPPCKP